MLYRCEIVKLKSTLWVQDQRSATQPPAEEKSPFPCREAGIGEFSAIVATLGLQGRLARMTSTNPEAALSANSGFS